MCQCAFTKSKFFVHSVQLSQFNNFNNNFSLTECAALVFATVDRGLRVVRQSSYPSLSDLSIIGRWQTFNTRSIESCISVLMTTSVVNNYLQGNSEKLSSLWKSGLVMVVSYLYVMEVMWRVLLLVCKTNRATLNTCSLNLRLEINWNRRTWPTQLVEPSLYGSAIKT